ncbi:hypothetical protein TW85_03540 [Marinomonas sp. S3726]|uniref:WbqC family protein n=1 Tax=Marinomonas sp. S3726 TaxID=579484 RepID=UPI0005FA2D44|nr:WbqC family protein [Marinomonas sp. S3726]KJZ15966.1 hypothetical protein TW85_03540 [Marinomonas sp. S3726]
MIVSIHQSQYLPWPAFFKKIAQSDVFVVMDNVQYQKNGVQNRNKVRNKAGDFWLTIPVSGNIDDMIKDKKTADEKWKKKHFQSLSQAYGKAPYWDDYCDFFKELYQSDFSLLHEINNAFMVYVLEQLDISTKVILMSELECQGEKSALVMDICSTLGATTYLSGVGSKAYLNEDEFSAAEIKIEYMVSINPVYTQIHGEFIPNLSILDMLFNVDKNTIKDYLHKP